MSTAKPTEFSCILKVSKQQLGTKPYQVLLDKNNLTTLTVITVTRAALLCHSLCIFNNLRSSFAIYFLHLVLSQTYSLLLSPVS